MSKKLEPNEDPVELRTRLPAWLDEKLAARAKARCQSKAAVVRGLVLADLAQDDKPEAWRQ